MNIEIKTITSENWETYAEDLEYFCKLSDNDESPAARNLTWHDWQNNLGSLMYTLVHGKRYDEGQGQFNLLYKDGLPIASSGCYVSDWSDKVLVMGARTWTSPDHRNTWWHGDYLLPMQVDVAKRLNCKAVVFTFNDYNSWLLKFINRASKGKAVTFGYKHSDFYKDFIVYDKGYNVKHTKQTLAVKLINCTQQEFEQNYLPPRYTE